MTTLTLKDFIHDQARLEAVSQYLPLVTAAYARAARTAARAAATPFALICMVDDTYLHFKAGFGLEIRYSKQNLPDNMGLFLTQSALQTNHPSHLETLNRLFSSKSGWQKYFFAFQASVPLQGADGQILGVLIVMDEQIRELDTHGLSMLEDIAEGLVAELDLHHQLQSQSKIPEALLPEILALEPEIQILEPEIQILEPELTLPDIEPLEPEIQPENDFDPAKLSQRNAAAMLAEDLNGQIMYANKAAAHLLGYSQDELLSINTAQLRSEDQQDLTPDLRAQLQEGITLLPIRAKRRHRNGQELKVSLALAPIFNSESKVIGISSTLILSPEREIVAPVEPIPNTQPQLPATVFSVNIEGQITAFTGMELEFFSNPQALIGQLIFKVFQPCEALLEAVCFALLGEEHESTIVIGSQTVRLHLHPAHRTGQPSDVIGIAIPVAKEETWKANLNLVR
jgi:PAS domain S-box-containing protein